MSFNFISINKASELTSEALLFLKTTDQTYFPTPWSDESWNHLFKEGSERFILMVREELFLGFALFDISIADSFAHLLKISVIPKARGRKVGEILLNQALQELKMQSIRSFFLEVEEVNISAIRLYEKMGFKTVHKKKHFYSNGASALIMTLDV